MKKLALVVLVSAFLGQAIASGLTSLLSDFQNTVNDRVAMIDASAR